MAVDASTIGAVLQCSAVGCCVMASTTVKTGPRACGGEPVAAAEVLYRHDGSIWLAFLCADHADLIPAARPLTAGDRAELADRRERLAAALSGRGWVRLRPVRAGQTRRR